MASQRTGSRTDDTTYVRVLHRLNGRHTSFHDHVSASKFRDLVNQGGPAKVLEVIGVGPRTQTTTLAEWLKQHIPGRRAIRLEVGRLVGGPGERSVTADVGCRRSTGPSCRAGPGVAGIGV